MIFGISSWLVRRNARSESSVVELRFAIKKKEGAEGFGERSPIPIPWQSAQIFCANWKPGSRSTSTAIACGAKCRKMVAKKTDAVLGYRLVFLTRLKKVSGLLPVI